MFQTTMMNYEDKELSNFTKIKHRTMHKIVNKLKASRQFIWEHTEHEEALIKYLQASNLYSLTLLDLSKIYITQIESLSKILSRAKNLRILSFQLMDGEDLSIIEKALSNLKRLDKLSIKLYCLHNKNELVKTISSNMQKLTDLQLCVCRVTSDDMSNLNLGNLEKSLTRLDLSGNNLTDEGAGHIVKHLKNLKHLILDNNLLTNEAGKYLAHGDLSNLLTLNISCSESINHSMCQYLTQVNLTGLKCLDLSGNSIGNEGCGYISKADLISLEVLELADNDITDDGFSDLAQGNFTQIKTLNLNENKIRSGGMRSLENFEELQSLYLHGNKITSNGCKILVELSHKALKKLNLLVLSWNAIEEEGAVFLKEGNFNNLSELFLISTYLGPEGVNALSQCNFNNVTTMDLTKNRIGTEGCLHLSKSNFKNLTSLDLTNNKIGSEGCKYLADGNLSALILLDLESNNIDEEGAQYLAHGNLVNLSCLYLQENKIGSLGCKYLSNGAEKLTKLNLSKNSIGAEGCKYLAQGLLSHINTLNLCNNSICSEGCFYISQGDLHHINYLDLSFNDIDNDGIESILQGDFKQLNYIGLKGNRVKVNEVEMMKIITYRTYE